MNTSSNIVKGPNSNDMNNVDGINAISNENIGTLVET